MTTLWSGSAWKRFPSDSAILNSVCLPRESSVNRLPNSILTFESRVHVQNSIQTDEKQTKLQRQVGRSGWSLGRLSQQLRLVRRTHSTQKYVPSAAVKLKIFIFSTVFFFFFKDFYLSALQNFTFLRNEPRSLSYRLTLCFCMPVTYYFRYTQLFLCTQTKRLLVISGIDRHYTYWAHQKQLRASLQCVQHHSGEVGWYLQANIVSDMKNI